MSIRQSTQKFVEWIWNGWCVASIIGIWPRFIEPNCLSTTKLSLSIGNLPQQLKGLRILQISDLHLSESVSSYFLEKLKKRIKELNPDLIFFTGDFINFASIDNPKRLLDVLLCFKAPFGSFAVFGNHDYQKYVTINKNGDYDFAEIKPSQVRGFRRLFKKPKISGKRSSHLKQLPFNSQLTELLKQSSIQLLHNDSKLIPIQGTYLNICGLGEYMAGWNLPEEAFKNYDKKFPGIVLSHNPDSIPHLINFPGNIILCGHTHGGQINIPGLRHNFTVLENPHFMRGLHQVGDKQAYINRGLGGAMHFRWFSCPEILLLTLETA